MVCGKGFARFNDARVAIEDMIVAFRVQHQPEEPR